jgi:hypothetical protein
MRLGRVFKKRIANSEFEARPSEPGLLRFLQH